MRWRRVASTRSVVCVITGHGSRTPTRRSPSADGGRDEPEIAPTTHLFLRAGARGSRIAGSWAPGRDRPATRPRKCGPWHVNLVLDAGQAAESAPFPAGDGTFLAPRVTAPRRRFRDRYPAPSPRLGRRACGDCPTALPALPGAASPGRARSGALCRCRAAIDETPAAPSRRCHRAASQRCRTGSGRRWLRAQGLARCRRRASVPH